jgi:hypothetical protein
MGFVSTAARCALPDHLERGLGAIVARAYDDRQAWARVRQRAEDTPAQKRGAVIKIEKYDVCVVRRDRKDFIGRDPVYN